MKRRRLLRYLEKHGCYFLREGAGHTIYVKLAGNLKSPVPRHPEINPVIVRKICKQLDIPIPREK